MSAAMMVLLLMSAVLITSVASRRPDVWRTRERCEEKCEGYCRHKYPDFKSHECNADTWSFPNEPSTLMWFCGCSD